jgi:hypothetical protein
LAWDGKDRHHDVASSPDCHRLGASGLTTERVGWFSLHCQTHTLRAKQSYFVQSMQGNVPDGASPGAIRTYFFARARTSPVQSNRVPCKAMPSLAKRNRLRKPGWAAGVPGQGRARRESPDHWLPCTPPRFPESRPQAPPIANPLPQPPLRRADSWAKPGVTQSHDLGATAPATEQNDESNCPPKRGQRGRSPSAAW